MSMRAPLIWEFPVDMPAQAGVTTGQQAILGEVQESGTLTEFSIVPGSAVTANTNNYRIFTLYNRGTAGTGTVVMGTIDTSTTGFTDNVERVATLATAANLAIAPLSILELVETTASSGVAHGGYRAMAKVSRY